MHRLFKRAAAFLAAVVAPTVALAAVDPTCVALAREIATGETIHYGESDLAALSYYSMCEASKDIDSFGLDVDVIDIVKVGIDLDEDEARQYCEQNKNAFVASNISFVKSKQLFREALGTINRCIQASERGWAVEYSQIHQDAVSLDISNGFPEGAKINGIDIIPAEGVTCAGLPETFPTLITSTERVSMTCIRTPSKTLAEGIQVTTAPDVTVNLRLAGGPFPIRLPGYESSILERLRSEIRAVGTQSEASISTLKSALLSRSGPVTEVHLKDTDAFPGKLSLPTYAKSCPEGQYLAGLEMYGGRHDDCIGCMLAVNLICKPVAVE